MPIEPNESSQEPELEDLASLGRSEGSKRSSRRNAGRKRKIVIALVLLALVALGGGVYVVGRFALNDPRFRLESVQVEGGKYVSASEVEEKFTGDRDRSVLRVPLERRRREIEQIPWVRSASLRRVLPGELRVIVKERVPVAFVARPDGLALVDEDGVFLETPKDSSFNFPVVRGLREDQTPQSRREKMRLYMALMKDLEHGGLQANKMLSEVDVEDPQDARMIVSDSSDAVVLHLGKDSFMARYMIYLGHMDEWKQKFPSIHSVDLRYDGQVVINADPQRQAKEQKEQKEQPKGTAAIPAAPQASSKVLPKASTQALPAPAPKNASKPVPQRVSKAAPQSAPLADGPGAVAESIPPAIPNPR